MYRIALYIALLLMPVLLTAQSADKVHIDWEPMMSQSSSTGANINYFIFDGATNLYKYGALPLYVKELELPSNYLDFQIDIHVVKYDTLDQSIRDKLSDNDLINEELQYDIHYSGLSAQLYILPFRYTKTGDIIRFLDIEIIAELVPSAENRQPKNTTSDYTTTSVLNSGTWYKMGIIQTGVHKLSYNDLLGYGIDPGSINPEQIGIFGNYNGMLPEGNIKFRPDDLQENSIQIIGGDDGKFDEEDYILFYGQSATTWKYNIFTGRFDHSNNIYTDTTYYFLTTDAGTKKKIQTESSLDVEPTETVLSFYDYDVHEKDIENLMSSGKDWYGERFTGDTTERTFTFNFPNQIKNRPIYLHFDMVARGLINTYAEVYVNGELIIDSTRFIKVSSNSNIYAQRQSRKVTFFVDQDDIEVKVKYYADDPAAIGWLNFLELNVERDMTFEGGQMMFCDPHIGASGNITEFQLEGVSESINIWDITDPFNPLNIAYNFSNNSLDFTIPTDTLRNFIAFNQTGFHRPVEIIQIENQNLHGISNLNFLIISPEMFKEQAERLAKIHSEKDGLTTIVLTPEKIYNEFSSGSQDVSAIRDLMRMLWNKGAFGNDPGYLLLFGDASFDYKHRIHENTNIIPTYQSKESLRETKSFVTDDYFGLLDDDEGEYCRGNLDIGIGRFPVSTIEDAESSVDKIDHYLQNNKQVMRPWRNTLCFVADDADHNLHMHQAKYLIGTADTVAPYFNLNNVFSDAFTKVKVPGGKRFPDVNKKIIDQVQEGALIVNYTGHGGLIGWSEEIILDVPTIRGFDNLDNMPLFITATCEFSRFDDPEFVSAGEYLFLNKKGGGIALLTTTRLAFAAANIIVNQRIYRHFIEREDGERPRLGDLVRLSKIPSNDNFLNFALLGDPALQLAYPQYEVVTTSVNDVPVSGQADTIHALSLVSVNGHISDALGSKMENFNGYIYPKVYDKYSEYMTLGTEIDSSPEEFELMDKVLFNGKTSVINGEFSFTFLVPKDISYRYGFGKISYYALDTTAYVDAWGAYNQIYIGGVDNEVDPDEQGPEITLYLNDKSFQSGDQVSLNSNFYADLFDQQGIHSTGHSLGRDIILTMDEDMANGIIMNQYYNPDVDTYKSGTITYQLSDLSDGWHTLTLKAWDLQNNSSDATIDFYVDENAEILLSNVVNYPNPFFNETYFGFVHNKNGSNLEVQVNIYDLHGRYVCQIDEKTGSSGNEAIPIKWDGKDHNGNPLPGGLYTYHIIVTDYTGNTTIQRQKMIKLND